MSRAAQLGDRAGGDVRGGGEQGEGAVSGVVVSVLPARADPHRQRRWGGPIQGLNLRYVVHTSTIAFNREQ